jgi:hypothetical protein
MDLFLFHGASAMTAVTGMPRPAPSRHRAAGPLFLNPIELIRKFAVAASLALDGLVAAALPATLGLRAKTQAGPVELGRDGLVWLVRAFRCAISCHHDNPKRCLRGDAAAGTQSRLAERGRCKRGEFSARVSPDCRRADCQIRAHHPGRVNSCRLTSPKALPC